MDLSIIRTEDVDERRKRLTDPFEIALPNMKFRLRIKEGFTYDGASIPKWAWSIVGSPFTGKYRRAALMHDGLYSAEVFDRIWCDLVLRDQMIVDGVEFWRRNVMWLAVAWRGWKVWESHTREQVDKAQEFVYLLPVNN